MSLRANELRLGNWVETYSVLVSGAWYDNKGTRHGFDTVTEPAISQRQIDLEDLKIIHEAKGLATYRGIPLTPEVLLACWFEYQKIEGISRLSYDFDDAPEGDTHNWTLKVPKNDHVEDLPRFELVKFGDGEIKFSHQWLRVTVKYLHQLQNLYFAITGGELIYSPVK